MKEDDKGQVLVEFALTALLFLTLVFGVVDLGYMFYVNLTMQHAVREGTRFLVTGQGAASNDRISFLIDKIRANSNGLYDKNLHDPKAPQISVIDPGQVSFTNYSGTPANDAPAGPNDITAVRLTYTGALMTPLLKPFFPNGQYTFTVKSTTKN